MSNPTRREFLHTVGAGAALAPLLQKAARPDEWSAVRSHFLIPPERSFLNVGTLGAQPATVVDAVMEATRKVAESTPPGVKWEDLKAGFAALLDCDGEGFVFPRNTTEAMNFIANGLELSAGDQILTTNHEHVGGLCCWQLVAKRHNLTLTQVDISPAPQDPDAVFHQMTAAVTAHTRVMSVSHLNFSTGFIMPVQQLSQWCRQRGIVFVVDGAHPPGLMRTSIRAIDPDFYASSPHKWLLAPQGSGLLYIREDWRTKLWPTLASGGWDDLEMGAQRFNHLGTIDESRFAGLQAALAFHNQLGPDRVYARIEELRQHLLRALSANTRVRIVSPRDARGAGMVSFTVDGVDAAELQKTLGAHNIRTRVIGEYKYGYMRLSPHVYTSFAELERVAALIAAA